MLIIPSVGGDRIARVFAILNRDKLARFHATWLAQQ